MFTLIFSQNIRLFWKIRVYNHVQFKTFCNFQKISLKISAHPGGFPFPCLTEIKITFLRYCWYRRYKTGFRFGRQVWTKSYLCLIWFNIWLWIVFDTRLLDNKNISSMSICCVNFGDWFLQKVTLAFISLILVRYKWYLRQTFGWLKSGSQTWK